MVVVAHVAHRRRHHQVVHIPMVMVILMVMVNYISMNNKLLYPLHHFGRLPSLL
jgi:hypothetical protein